MEQTFFDVAQIHSTAIALTIAGALATAMSPSGATTAIPRYDHVVIVIMENHAYSSIIGNASAPWINVLSTTGASFTQAFGVTHPSQPNYIALFSGSQQGVVDNSCPIDLGGTENLASQLGVAGLTFIGYAEDLPSVGYADCSVGSYHRRHNPWVNFSNVPTSANQPFSAFPTDFSTLPQVAIVVPNLCNDMHDCPVATGDAWLAANFESYRSWANTHNSLLIVTFDEDDGSEGNRIATIFSGQHVLPMPSTQTIDHYSLLATIEAMYDLPALLTAADRSAIIGIFDERIFSNGFE